MIPTQRTIAWCKRNDMKPGNVQRYIAKIKRFQDLFGFIDIIALPAVGKLVAIQATSGTNHASRVKKVRTFVELRHLLNCGVRVEVHSWTKKKRGYEKPTWVLRRTVFAYGEGAQMVRIIESDYEEVC